MSKPQDNEIEVSTGSEGTVKVSKGKTMKIDYKRTLCIGLAFAGIMLFWEIYDYIMPLILQRYFGLSQSQYGAIMGLDNILALFLLPIFGALSDRSTKAKIGRRTIFVLIGTLIAVVGLVVLAIVEQAQFSKLMEQNITDANALVNAGYLDASYLQGQFKEVVDLVNAQGVGVLNAEQLEIYKGDSGYLTALYVAQVAMANATMKASPAIFIIFIFILVALLVAMSSYRSPAVAYMPDVTPKPLRSQANALITLMGGAGGLIAILLYTAFGKQRYQSHLALFLTEAAFMLVLLVIFMVTTNEKKFNQMRINEEKEWGIIDEEEVAGNERLSKPKMISLILILLTVFFWFLGFNAVKSHLSTYATAQLKFSDSFVGIINIINGAGGAIALLPVAIMAGKWGRKKTILAGLVLAALAFVPCLFLKATTPLVNIWFPLCFILSGFGLVIINVNTLPMVTELSRGSNVGKYTGLYYVFSMGAQSITPFMAGKIMEWTGNQYVFLYAILFILVGFVTMFFVKHGDNKPPKKAKVIEYFGEED